MKEEEGVLFWIFALLQLIGLGMIINEYASSIIFLIGGVLFGFGLVGFEYLLHYKYRS